MMIVQHILDRDLPLTIPEVREVRKDFAYVRDLLALAQEQKVTEQNEALLAAARAERDPLKEQSMLWFPKEQVEEIVSMTTLVNIAARADNLFDIEYYLAREHSGDKSHHHAGHGSGTPEAAGGAARPGLKVGRASASNPCFTYGRFSDIHPQELSHLFELPTDRRTAIAPPKDRRSSSSTQAEHLTPIACCGDNHLMLQRLGHVDARMSVPHPYM